MKYMLDTNICIYAMKNKSDNIVNRFAEAANKGICISAITLSELEYGICASVHKQKNRNVLIKFLTIPAILPFNSAAAVKYGEICADLKRKETPIGKFDMLIAAHCLSENLVLVTDNTREFERVEGLKIENWA